MECICVCYKFVRTNIDYIFM